MGISSVVQNQLKHDTPYAWFLRHQASSSPLFYRQHLVELDNRLEAYLDCYLISEREGNSLLPDLSFDDWGSVFVTALTALRSNNSEALETAINAVSTKQQSKELSDAFCWVDFDTAKPHFNPLAHHDNYHIRVASVIAAGYFSKHIKPSMLEDKLGDKSPDVIIAALTVIGDNKLKQHAKSVSLYLDSIDDDIRFQAAYTACMLEMQGAIGFLQNYCFKENPHLRQALSLLYQVVNPASIPSVLNRIQQAKLSPRIKTYNIAMAGLPDKIPVLLEWMKDPEYAPLAGEAFSFITGVDIEEDDLSILHVELCESQEAPLAEKRKQDPWTENYEDDLPWPDPKLVKQWWDNHQQDFQDGTRYLAGKTLKPEHLKQTRQKGTQPQRHIAQLILSIKDAQSVFKTVKGRAI